ncbi:MAG: hypothetical protein RBU37_03085 [Myxococcota bacterium]|jgi:hypothetical protein|nr:hypothetical protein [Myxococcota bacterium]
MSARCCVAKAGTHQTKAVVESGVAIERSFHPFDREGTVTESWQECATVVLTQNPDENWSGVSFGKDGELISCSYFPMNCVDDCSEGLGHLNFTWKP